MKRRLTLRTEHLDDLAPEQLVDVAAGRDVTGGGLLCVTQWPTVCEIDNCYSVPGC